jgi:hypothetical protein
MYKLFSVSSLTAKPFRVKNETALLFESRSVKKY